MGNDRAAHAVCDDHSWFGARREHLADTLRAGLERHALDGRVVLACARKIEGLDRVTRRLERTHHGLLAPGAAEGTVDEDDACQAGTSLDVRSRLPAQHMPERHACERLRPD